MSILVSTNSVTWQGNGATTVFIYTFAMPCVSDATLLYTTAAGVQTTVAPSAYLLTGVGQPTVGGGPQGGTVTYAPGGLPIPTGSRLTLIRTVPDIQPNTFINQGTALLAPEIEASDDNLAMQIQQVASGVGRAILFNPADTGPFPSLPPAAQRANAVLGFDSSGNPIAVQPPSGAQISPAMQPVAAAATLSVAAGLLGITPALQPVVGSSSVAAALALLGAMPSFANMAALRANTSTPACAFLQGFYGPADGGEGNFVYIATDTRSADNGGTIIVDAAGHRWYRDCGKGPLNVCWFGACINSVTDSSAAVGAALAVGNNILFPAGYFTLASPITYTFPNNISSLTIAGCGSRVTELIWPTAASGFTINYAGPLNSLHMRDITLATGVAGTSGAAVLLNQAAALGAENAWDQSDFTNVTIRGCDGPDLTYYWGTGIQINGVSGVNFFNLKIDGQQIAPYSSVGVGVSIYGTAAIIPVVYNFTNCNFTYLGSGLSYGAYVQGVTLSQCNFTGGAIGVISPASAVGTVLSQLAVVGCQFNCSNYGIYNDAGIAAVTVSGTYFFELQPGSVGIYLAQTEAFSIINNVFEGPGGTNTSYGINIGTNPLSFAGVISGNVFFRNYYGVVLEASSSCVNLQSNGWSANTNNYINMGSNNTIGGGSV